MDQSEAFRRVWQTFRSFQTLADGRHDTVDWRSHDGVYAVCAVRVPAEKLQPTLEECRAAVGRFPFARIHPDHFLHITLQELGFVCDRPNRVDEIAPARLEEFAAAAADAIGDWPPFTIHLGGVNSYQDAAFLDVHDRGRCAELHLRLNEVAAVPHLSRFAYLPHSTIAHYTAAVPSAGLAGALAPWRDVRFGSFSVTAVEIVTLRVEEPYPALEPYAIIPFDG